MCGRRNSRRRSRDAIQCTVVAWVDHFESWRRELERREEMSDIRVALKSAPHSSTRRRRGLRAAMPQFSLSGPRSCATPEGARRPMSRHYGPWRWIRRARRSLRGMRIAAWRRAPPWSSSSIASARRSAAGMNCFRGRPRRKSAQHGKFSDVEARLPYLAEMGFDVLYFPPIHPIGRVNRKGTNNALRAKPGDVGSPWAIGAAEGGHKDILPQLGSFEDFERLAGCGARAGHRNRPGHRVSMRSGPSVRDAASAVVQAPPRRQRAIRRESSEEISGHLSVRFRDRATGARCGPNSRASSTSGSHAGVQNFPRRQSAYQGVRFLGMADQRHQSAIIRTSSSSPRPLPGRRSCTGWPNWASRSRTRISPGAIPSRN